ncbi:mitochondrial transcription termination factorfamily protein [Striga asiatica]|uniref:Mitochondrial transcription termination factorfamily protein n=1 Tax=Striga asiatica TaxID=4170 RepID=A0A5A7NZF5_STRAF|nr:mitochondrial transcription termination factorfamily protein [Striga asiatica]
MNRLNKRIISHFFKWVPLLCAKDYCIAANSNYYVTGPRHILQHLRFASTESALNLRNGGGSPRELAKRLRSTIEEAQAALLDYFHMTRSLQFLDAENMSKNTPDFLVKLLQKVNVDDGNVERLVARYLRYHPVNEFEPFFESIGLKPSEFSSLLPQNLMFLNDDELLMENYYVLCQYGIPRGRIGKIYKEAREVFGYNYGVLMSKLQPYENFGLKQSCIAKVVASSPRLLVGSGVDPDFAEFLKKLKDVGIEYDWLEKHISMKDSYDWKCMLEAIPSLHKLGLSDKQLRRIFTSHPDILLESSGRITFLLFGSLLKFGATSNIFRKVLLEFPKIRLVKFTRNFLHCYKFLVEINMDAQDIGKIVCSHVTVLGTCELKKVKSLTNLLNCGRSRLRQLINDDPFVLKKWVLGLKLVPLPLEKIAVDVRKVKTEFLVSLGFVENSKEIKKALKMLRGRGTELRERFDCLVEIGLRREDVIKMVKSNPHVLNQSTDVLRSKADALVKELGLSASDWGDYPKILLYTTARVKLRLLMYAWLKRKRFVRAGLTLCTLLSTSDEIFVKVYVNPHRGGKVYWNGLKKRVGSDD